MVLIGPPYFQFPNSFYSTVLSQKEWGWSTADYLVNLSWVIKVSIAIEWVILQSSQQGSWKKPLTMAMNALQLYKTSKEDSYRKPLVRLPATLSREGSWAHLEPLLWTSASLDEIFFSGETKVGQLRQFLTELWQIFAHSWLIFVSNIMWIIISWVILLKNSG